MADPNTRQGKRTPVTLKIKFKSETLEQFIERYAVDVSQGGIFIRTKEPLAVGTQMKFEFQLRDASPLIAGEGTVVWTRENDPSRPAIAPGMGVRFDRLAEGSQGVLEKILAEKAKQAPQRGGTNEGQTKPPMFTDTPTRVAPAPVQDQLLGPSDRSGRRRADSEKTPLPKPMPFHSDADEFGAEAFEEATKVRSLDELAAQSAAADPDPQTATAIMPADELAMRRGGRADSTSPLVDPPTPDGLVEGRARPVPDRDSAPGLPSPPEPSGRAGKLLDTSPSPRSATPSTGPAMRGSGPISKLDGDGMKTRLGMEPAKAPTGAKYEPTERVSTPRAVAAESAPLPEAPSRPSSAPIVIGILVVVAAAMAAVWYFVLRTDAIEQQAITKPTTGSAVATTTTGSAEPVGSAAPTATGSAVAMTGSAGAGMTGSATPPAKGPVVETEIVSNIAKSTVTIVDTDQTGPAPFKAKLEKDKLYKVRVEAPGYVKSELDVKGGQDKATAKLTAKLHVLSVASEPPGAAIFIDNAPTNKVTPFDVELTAAQAAKPKLHVTLRKNGFRPVDQMVDAATFADEDTRMVAKIDARLAVMIQINTPPTNTTNTHTGTAGSNGAGSATTGAGSDSSETPKEPKETPKEPKEPPKELNGGGAGSSTGGSAPPASGSLTKPSSGSAEPEPDWSKRQ